MSARKHGPHLLTPTKVIKTSESLSGEIIERYPDSEIADLSLNLIKIAKNTEEKINDATKPIYWLRFASAIAICLIVAAPIFTIQITEAKWEFETITDLFEAADAGVNMVILLVGTLWFLFNIEARQWRKKALSALTEIREFIHVIDVMQLYFSPSLKEEETSLTRGGQAVDLRYLFLCSRMVGVLSNVAVLFTQGESDEAVWRAVSEIESLANAVALKLTNKIEVLPLVRAP